MIGMRKKSRGKLMISSQEPIDALSPFRNGTALLTKFDAQAVGKNHL
jgi:hypothetical protein